MFYLPFAAILTNPQIIKVGHSVRAGLQTIADQFLLPEISKLAKAKNPPILDLGMYAKLKGVWCIYATIDQLNDLGLPLQPTQATKPRQLVTIVQACKPVAEGSLAEHPGYLHAVMDDNGTTKKINVTPSRSVVLISKVLVPSTIHRLCGQTMEWIFTHGAEAVVSTSQLLMHSKKPLISSAIILKQSKNLSKNMFSQLGDVKETLLPGLALTVVTDQTD
ncbi:hypothetical protein B0H14DRAFT_2569005 [Mycena olivaceomarginata]|nr:hypothetical protein B0H14DRAFT_2569005 [Mycena olivaceomarginata]